MPLTGSRGDWPRATVKAAAAIWGRLHTTGREPRRFGELDGDTLDDLCIQAEAAITAYQTETRTTRARDGLGTD